MNSALSPAKQMPIIRLSFFHGIVQMIKVATNFFIALHFVKIGFSGAEIGLIFGLHSLITLITILPSGISNDSFKSKHLITISLILLVFEYFALAYTQSFILLTILFALGGIGNALFVSSAESLFHKASNKQDLSKRIAIFQGIEYALISSGIILAGALLNFNFQFESIFLGTALFFIFMAIVSLSLPNSETTKLELLHYQKDIFRKEVLFFLLMLLIFSIHFGAEMTSYGLFLENNLGLNKLEMGLYMGFAVAFMSLASYIIHKRSGKWKAKYLLIWGLFLSGFFHILMVVNNPILSFFSRTIHEIGDSATFFFIYVGVNKLFDLKRIGGNNGIIRLTTQIGLALGAFMFGPIGTIYGYHWPLVISGGTTLIAFLLALYFSKLIDH